MRAVIRSAPAALTVLLISNMAVAVDVPATAKDQVERQCLPAQLRAGADAYRQCVTEQLARIGDASSTSTTGLSMDERFLVQSSCGLTDAACIEEQVNLLASEPAVSLAALSIDEQLVLSDTCLQSNNGQGALTFRRCASEQIAQLAALPKPALDTLTLLERNALELSCGGDTANVISYRQCLVEMAGGESASDSSDAVANPTTSQTDSPRTPFESQDNDSVNAAEVASSDFLDLGNGDLPVSTNDNGSEAASDAGQGDLTDAAPETADSSGSIEAAGVAGLINDARARLANSWQGLDTVGRSVLGAAIVLPLLLVALWVVMRNREDNEEEFEYETAGPDERREPDLGLEDDAQPLNLDEEIHAFEAPATAGPQTTLATGMHDDSLQETRLAQPLSAAQRGAQQPSLEREIDLDLDANVTRVAPKPEMNLSEHRQKPADLAWQSAFGAWICEQPPRSRLQSVIELFIYWVAYGDDRYDEQMREAVLSNPDPDSHDLIKRWVLQNDAYALADAITWMQSHASRAERYQTLDLLMTLLVTDGAMTPVQNTLLRFLSDAFGLGEAELDLQYSRAFGEPMPALPRVDKPNWWAQQDQVRMERWDALSLLRRPEHEQYRIRLGLSLAGELDQQDINDAYRRAARRCQPERFDALGQRELALVKRQLGKLHEAREGLLGVNA